MQQESEYGHQWHCPEKSIVHEANMHSAGGRDGKINIGIAGLTLTAIENAETNKLLNILCCNDTPTVERGSSTMM